RYEVLGRLVASVAQHAKRRARAAIPAARHVDEVITGGLDTGRGGDVTAPRRRAAGFEASRRDLGLEEPRRHAAKPMRKRVAHVLPQPLQRLDARHLRGVSSASRAAPCRQSIMRAKPCAARSAPRRTAPAYTASRPA